MTHIDNIVSALTSVLLLQWPLAHDCDGDFERENAKLPRSLAEKYFNVREIIHFHELPNFTSRRR